MGNLDMTSKVFVQKPEVFKDVFKLVFQDDQVTLSELNPMEPEMMFAQRLPASGKTRRIRKRRKAQKALMLASFSRDIVKSCICAVDNDADYMVLAVENQSYIDRFMPARVMIYDALTLHAQMEMLKSQDWSQLTSDEFLTGVPSDIMLKPIITVVCYFGTKPWNGPRSLHEILDIKNPKLKAFIPNYPICIIDPHSLSEDQLQHLDSSLREVFICIKSSSHRKTLKEVINSSHRFQHMDPDAVNLIKAALNLDIQIDTNQKEINMCQAVEEWKQELLDEGYENGEKAGYANGEKAGYANGKLDGEKAGYVAILSSLIQNSDLSLPEIAKMTGQQLSFVQEVADLNESL